MTENTGYQERFHFGTRGWTGKQLKAGFYPLSMKPPRYLRYYSSRFNLVEVPSTSGSLPHSATIDQWYFQTPPDFLFCPHVPRKSFKNDSETKCFREFIDRLKLLGKKLGPLLINVENLDNEKKIENTGEFLHDLPANYRYVVAGDIEKLGVIRSIKGSLDRENITVAEVVDVAEEKIMSVDSPFLYWYVTLENVSGKKTAYWLADRLKEPIKDMLAKGREVFLILRDGSGESIVLVRDRLLKNIDR